MPEAPVGKSKGKKKPKEEVVKKVVTPEQADAFKSVVSQIAAASTVEETKEPEGKTEILNAVLESLPEGPAPKKAKRRRVINLGKSRSEE